MKKSNWIAFAIAAIISIVLLCLWFYLGFNHVDSPLDLVISIIWWVVIIALCYGIYRVEKKRMERLRTCYVLAGEPGSYYNSEAGVVQMQQVMEQARQNGQPEPTMVDAIQETLEKLEYGFDIAEMPSKDDEGVEYKYIVRNTTFKVKDEDEQQAQQQANADASAAQQDNEEEVEWEGEVQSVEDPDADPIPFKSKEELAAILQA